MNFGDRLASLRKLNNLTRKELAKIFSISYSALSNYENNERFPDQEMLINIANYFNVSVDYLLGRTDIKQPASNIIKEQENITSDSNKITKDFNSLSPQSQKEIQKLMDLYKIKDKIERNNKVETSDDLASIE